MEHAACFEESPSAIAWAEFNGDRAEQGLPPVSYEEWCLLTTPPELTADEVAILAELEEEVEL